MPMLGTFIAGAAIGGSAKWVYDSWKIKGKTIPVVDMDENSAETTATTESNSSEE